MKVWLDDERDPKKFKGWEDAIWVTTPEEAIELLMTDEVVALSLDNDLGLPDAEDFVDLQGYTRKGQPRDGYMVACWLEERIVTDDEFLPPDILNAHTANGVNASKMEAAFRKIRRTVASR